jgi:hypothetical protein
MCLLINYNFIIKNCEKGKKYLEKKNNKINLKIEKGLTKIIKSFIRHVLLFHKGQKFGQ